MKRSLFGRVLAGAVLGICLVAAGCVSPAPTESEKEEMEIRPFEAVTEYREDGADIYVVLNVYTNSYWQRLIEGLSQAGTELGCNVYVGGSAKEAGRDKAQAALVEEAVEKEADVLVLAPVNSEGQVGQLEEVYAKGTPLVLVDSGLNSGSYSQSLMTDNLRAGETAAKEMLRIWEEMGISPEEEAQVAIQLGSATNQTLVDRLAGFSRYWYRHAPDTWSITKEVKCNNGDVELAVQYGKDCLQAYPKLRGLFSCNNGSSIGFARALAKSGRRDVAMVGFDFSDELSLLVRSEEYFAAAVAQHPYEMGYQAVETACLLARGEKPDRKFVDTGVYVVNRHNVNDPSIQSRLAK